MVSVSKLTRDLIHEKPYIHEALEKNLINITALAEMLKVDVEKELGKTKISAISMAIRRYVDEQTEAKYKKVTLTSGVNITLKSDLFEISLAKSPSINEKIIELYRAIDAGSGDTLNIIQGNHEVLIISDAIHQQKFEKLLKGQKIKRIKTNISSLSIRIPREVIDTPGFYYAITKILAIENIPITDIVNTENEATLIIDDKYVSKAYNLLKQNIKIEYWK
ncbi:MAG: hypothetical protein WC758_03700 [Candidatus Woesearchaeota archaeon]|jgi:aspartokinase